MKKAKRLLAMLLAVVMIFCASSVSVYASTMDNDYHTPGDNNGKYWFDYEQGCGYVLDLLDNILADVNIYITQDELNDMTISGLYETLLNLDGYMKNDDISTDDTNGDGFEDNRVIDLRSLDVALPTLYSVLRCIHSNGLVSVVDAIAGVFGDLLDKTKGLPQMDDAGKVLRRGYTTVDDRQVLEFLISYVASLDTMLGYILTGQFDWGMLADMLPAEIQDIPGLLKNLLYGMLVDETADAAPADFNIDNAVQQLINWALIEGTGAEGSGVSTGEKSMLGPDFEPLLPALKDQPGKAGIFEADIDRDGDGVNESKMSFYQLISNVIQAFLSGTVADMLSEMLFDMLDVEITEQYPMGDPAIVNDTMFVTIVGAVEGLLTANGATPHEYTEEENTYPVPKINALMTWLFDEGALDTFINIQFEGISLTDNFMSLLNDVARLLINLLPSLGLFEDSAHLSYTPDQLNEVWYIDANYNIVSPTDENKTVQTYVTFETGDVIYPTAFVGNTTTPEAYCYLESKEAVILIDENGVGDVDADLVRPNYVVSTDKVFANIIKMALNDFIDGCYFPEWTEDIPSVLAYGFAALAAPELPDNNYYARLDAFHEAEVNGGAAVVNATGTEIEPLQYTAKRTINGVEVEIPYAALCIISSYLADTLNAVLMLGTRRLTTETTLERFACEFFAWALDTYMPMFIGKDIDDVNTTFVNGTWTDATLVFINDVFGTQANFASNTVKADADFDAIYALLDSTLFTLLPTSWLPGITGSEQLVNQTLLANLIEFNLQGILDLLSVNPDTTGELHLPVMTVLIRIIDRVLALIFNDNSVIPSSRTNVVKNQNLTSITSLDTLLDCSSLTATLPSLVSNLLAHLNTYKTPLLATVLPLIVTTSYERPFDSYLTASGRTMSTYGIDKVKEYALSFEENINANVYREVLNEYVPTDVNGNALEDVTAADFAYAAVDGDAQILKSADGTMTNVVLSNNALYGSYATRPEAAAVVEVLKDAYVFEKPNGDIVIDEETEEEIELVDYYIYARESYLDCATADTVTDDLGEVTNYTNFTMSQLTGRTEAVPFASYDTDHYKFYGYADLSILTDSGFAYRNVNVAIDDAHEYYDSYHSFVENDLPNAYGDWLAFSVETQLRAKDLYDANDDGYSVLTDDGTDTDYVAPTTDADGNVTDPGVPVDGNPGIPSAMYPFSTTTATGFKARNFLTGKYVDGFYDTLTGTYITDVNMASFTTANFEQIAMAVELGNDTKYNVPLSDKDAENLVRLALNSLAFDITPDENGAYNAGSAQWETLGDNLSTVLTYLTNNGYTYEKVLNEDGTETGKYTILRPAFKLIDSSFNLGGLAAATPDPNAQNIGTLQHKSLTNSKNYTYAEKVSVQMHNSYKTYISSLYANRRSIYNLMDTISYRVEQAELLRAGKVETTMLKWIIELTEDDYYGDTRKRNLSYVYDENGLPVFEADGTTKKTSKVYTATSYKKFREAYDFGTALIETAEDANLQSSMITQTMVTEAYIGILEAWQQLVEFTGFADWTTLDAYIQIAYDILTDEYLDDPDFGVESGLENLQTAYDDALSLKADKENIDEERQGEINSTAAALNQAIQKLVYKQLPNILPAPEVETDSKVQNTKYDSGIQYANIYGLKEGVGIGDDLTDAVAAIEALGLKVTGMTVDGDNGQVIGTTSDYGVGGTGAKFQGRIERLLRFEYTAVLYGDLTGDARIDGSDVSALAIYLANGEANAAEMGEHKHEAADVNHDGKADPDDIQAIRNHYLLVKDGEIRQDVHGPVAE